MNSVKRFRVHDLAASRIPRAVIASPASTSLPEKSEEEYRDQASQSDSGSADNLDYHAEKFEWYEIRRGKHYSTDFSHVSGGLTWMCDS